MIKKKDLADWEVAPPPRRPNLELMAEQHAEVDGHCAAGCTYGDNVLYEYPCPLAAYALLELELLDRE